MSKYLPTSALRGETLGQRVRRLRMERRLSLRDFGFVSAATVCRVEAGHDCSLRAIVGIARAFGVSPSSLLRGCNFDGLTRE